MQPGLESEDETYIPENPVEERQVAELVTSFKMNGVGTGGTVMQLRFHSFQNIVIALSERTAYINKQQ